jgi:hypothetical protein
MSGGSTSDNICILPAPPDMSSTGLIIAHARHRQERQSLLGDVRICPVEVGQSFVDRPEEPIDGHSAIVSQGARSPPSAEESRSLS